MANVVVCNARPLSPNTFQPTAAVQTKNFTQLAGQLESPQINRNPKLNQNTK